ncbi:hypothetical protein [Streptomyces violens]|uniref:hypothetical protein n=1 Tax=Streptomyces violens TaxID=66377 RepID=UPI00068AB1DB|nr:hypothetical protein [Streptomyces violens]
MPRQTWDELPDAVRTAVLEHTGPLTGVVPVSDSFSSQFTATLETASGRVFVKGVRQEGELAWTHGREAAINPYVVPLSPKTLWRVTTDGWDLLGFEHVTGRSADYSPGSPDIPLVVDILTELGGIACPEGVEVERAEERWAKHAADPADATLFKGDALLHTDWFYTNVFVTGPDRARLIDWAWPTRGAAWIDPACWVVWMVFCGHTPQQAEQWAAKVPSWSAAPARSLDRFALAHTGYWQAMADEYPNDWTFGLRDAAARWAAHRSAVAGTSAGTPAGTPAGTSAGTA